MPGPLFPDETPILGKEFIASVDAERRRLLIPGAIVHARTPLLGSVTRGLGVEDVHTGAPLTADSPMRIGSITKTMVGTVVLRLVDEGRVQLDADIRDYLPAPVPPGVTVRRLLNMTSGLPDYTSEEFVAALLDHPERQWTPGELLEVAFRGEQRFEPGTSWEYCNAGYILLGLLIEAAAGDSLELVARRLVFDPLGLENTELPLPAPGLSALPRASVRGYHRRRENLVDATAINPSWAWAAGGAVSTAGDLSVYVKALARGTLLEARTQQQRMDMEPVADGIRYGLGIAAFSGMWGHNGGLPGFQSFAAYEPVTAATVVVLTNVDDSAADSLAAFVRTQLHTPSA
ncbi:serine hydrolase domain-containing protein [Streptomyces scopuliridis]|uniref:serine hydrolase domain-containing protein n=1 Tax=Streptomyces scopuliridis TaxID=452529 RepID=UPI00367CD066